MTRIARWCGVLLVAAAAGGVLAVPRPPAAAAAAADDRPGEASPRQAAARARAAGDAAAADRLEKAFADRVRVRLGTPTPVRVDPVKSGLTALSGAEKDEQLRDWALLAVYAQMDPDPRTARLALGTRPASRLAPTGGLTDTDYGPGRVAALGDGEYLVLVPPGPGGTGYDRATAARLLDDRRAADGRDPTRVWVAVYRIDRPAGGEPTVAVWVAGSVPPAEFRGRETGYVTRTVRTAGELAAALGEIDDLLGVTFEPTAVRVEGRALPRPAGARAPWRVDAADLAVIAAAAQKAGGGPNVGFSLDSWYDGAALKGELEKLAGDLAKVADPTVRRLAERVKAAAAAVDPKKAYPAPRGLLAPDESGLLGLLRSFRSELGPAGRAAADAVEEAIRPATFQAPRYEGDTAGTEVGMTLFYTDLVAKLYAMGAVRTPGGPAPVPLPAAGGFRLTPVTAVRVTETHDADVRRFPDGRLWFGARPAGVAVAADGGGVRFASVANALFMKVRENQTADEVEPNVPFVVFSREWNGHAREIYAAEPEYERLNQLLKWSAVFAAPATRGSHLTRLAGEARPPRSLTFAGWYRQGVRSGRLGVDLPLPFRAPAERKAGEPADSLRVIYSAPFSPIEGSSRVLLGGVTGYGPRDLLDSRPPAGRGPAPFGLRATPRLSEFDPGRFAQGERAVRQDGSGMRVGPDGTVTLSGAPGRSYFRDPGFDARPGPAGAEFRGRVDTAPGGGKPLAVEAEVGGLGGLPGKGRVEVGPAAAGGIELTVTPAPADALRAVADAVAANRPIPPGVAEIRVDPAGGALWVKPAGQGGWARIERDPRPTDPTGPGGVRFGPPGKRGGYQVSFPTGGPPAGAVAREGPGYVRLRVTDRGLGVERQPEWAAGRGARWPVRVNGQPGELSVTPAGEVVADARLADALKGVRSARELDDLAVAMLRTGQAGTTAEVYLPDAGVFLRRTGTEWELSAAPPAAAVLAGAGGGGGRPPVIRAVVEFPPDGPKGLRLGPDGTLYVPAGATAAVRQDAARVVGLLARSPQAARSATYMDALTPSKAERLLKDLPALTAAAARPPARAVVDGGAPAVELAGGLRLSLADAQAAVLGRQPLPSRWKELAGQTHALDLAGLSPADQARVLSALRVIEPALAEQNTRVVLRSGAAGWQERTRELLDWERATVQADRASLEQLGAGGKAVDEFLQGLGAAVPPLRPLLPPAGSLLLAPPTGRQLEVVVGHFAAGKNVLAQKTAEAKAGKFRDKAVVLFVCNDAPADMLAFAKAALENGARSVTIPAGKIDPRGALAIRELVRDSALGDGVSPAAAVRASYAPVITKLRAVEAAPDPAAAFRQQFGPDAAAAEKLFPAGVTRPAVRSLREQLERDQHQFRDTTRRDGRPGPGVSPELPRAA